MLPERGAGTVRTPDGFHVALHTAPKPSRDPGGPSSRSRLYLWGAVGVAALLLVAAAFFGFGSPSGGNSSLVASPGASEAPSVPGVAPAADELPLSSTYTTVEGAPTDVGDGATDGTSAGLDFSVGARVAAGGSGSTVVDGAPGELGELGAANAGATPPVSAVNEMTTPDARTAQTVRLRQIFNGAPIAHRLLRTLPRHCSRTQRPHSGLSADRQFRYSPGTRGRAGGTAASRARVYSSSGSAKSSTAGRYSTATPERMTSTSWLTC